MTESRSTIIFDLVLMRLLPMVMAAFGLWTEDELFLLFAIFLWLVADSWDRQKGK